MAIFKPTVAAVSTLPQYKGRGLLIVGVDDGHGLKPLPTPGKRTPPLPFDIDVDHDGKVERRKGERIFENEENRGIAQQVIEGLLRCGLGAVESAPGDTDPSLTQRQRTIRAAGAVVSISIHKNGAGSGAAWQNAQGISCFVHIDPACYTAAGERFAQYVLDEVAKVTGKVKRGNGKVSHKALSMVNQKYIGCPCALVEVGFQDQIKDAPEMLDPVFWDKVGEGIVRCCCLFLGVTYVPQGGNIPPQPLPKVPALTTICRADMVKAGDVLNIRTGPSMSYPIAGPGIPPGQAATVLDWPGLWIRVSRNGVVGYCNGSYTRPTNAKIAGTVNAASLNVRRATDSSDKAPKPIGLLAKGAKVTILGSVGQWYCIEYKGGIAFVQGNYVTV